MKIMGWWLRFKYGLGYESQPEDVIRRARNMAHSELAYLNKIFGKELYTRGTPADIQQRAIKRELVKYGDPEGTHKLLKMKTFVKC